MKPFDEIPFTNEFDQVIQPGQRILAITKGRSGSINTYEGTYLGSRTYETYWRKDPQVQVVCKVKTTDGGYWHEGKKVTKWSEIDRLDLKRESREVEKVTNLWANLIYPFA